MSAITYLFPNGALAPTQAQMERKYSAVHCTVVLDAAPADVIHNMQFDLAAPPEGLQLPVVIMNAIAGGPDAAVPCVVVKDGNTITVSKLGPGALTVDVWIFRHGKVSGFFG